MMEISLFGWLLLILGAADCGLGLFFIRQAENTEDPEKAKGKKIAGYVVSGSGFIFLLAGGALLAEIFNF